LEIIKYPHEDGSPWDETTDMYTAYCASLDHQKRTRDIKEEKKTLSLEAVHEKLERTHRIEEHKDVLRWCEICAKNFEDSNEVYRKIQQEHIDAGCAGHVFMCNKCYKPKLSKYRYQYA